MPQLKQLTCSVDWAPQATTFQEYGTVYGDGIVETYIAVPDHPQTFGIHLKSTGFIAQGIAAIVFVDGQYQCNRNRTNLKPYQKGQPSDTSQISFHLRQKEKSLGDGRCLGREWRFDGHNIVPALPMEVDSSHFDQLGTIEVLVLRCLSAEDFDGQRSRASSGADSHPLENAIRAEVEDGGDENASLPAYEPRDTVGTAASQGDSPNFEDEAGGMLSGLDLAQSDGPSDGPRNRNETRAPPFGFPTQPQSFAAGQYPPYAPHGHSAWSHSRHPRTGVPPPTAQDPRFADTVFDGQHPTQTASRQPRRVHFDFGLPSAPLAHPVHGANYGHPAPGGGTLWHDALYVPLHTARPAESAHTPWLYSPPPASHAEAHSVHGPYYRNHSDFHPYQQPPPTAQPLPQPAPIQSHPPTEQTEYCPAPHPQVPMRWPYPPGRQVPTALPPPDPSYHPYYFPTLAPYGYQVPTGYWPTPAPGTRANMPGHPNYAGGSPSGVDPARGHNSQNERNTFENQDWSPREPAGGNGSATNDNHLNTADESAQGGGGNSWDDQGNTNNDNAQGDGGGGGGDSWDDQDDQPVSIPNDDIWDQKPSENVPLNNENTTGWETNNNQPSGGDNWDRPPSKHGQNTGPNQTYDQPPHFTSDTTPQSRSLYGPYGAYYSLQPPAPDESEVGAEEEPRYDIPQSIVDETGSKMQVQGGRGYIYMHRGYKPEYIDSIEEPYARFVFKYRTREQLRQELGIELEVEPSGNAEVQHLQAMDKQAIIEMLLRAQNALDGKIPSPPPDVPSAASNVPTGELKSVPIPVPVPTTFSRKYTLPPPRHVSTSGGGGAGTGAFSSPNAAAAGQQTDTQNNQGWTNKSGDNSNNNNNNNNTSSDQQSTNDQKTTPSNQPSQPTQGWTNQVAPVKVLTKPTNHNQSSTTPHKKQKDVWEALEAGEILVQSSPAHLTTKPSWLSESGGWGDSSGNGNGNNAGGGGGGGGWEASNSNTGGGSSGVKW